MNTYLPSRLGCLLVIGLIAGWSNQVLAAKVVSISRATPSVENPEMLAREVSCSNDSTHRIVSRAGSPWCSAIDPAQCNKDRLKLAKQLCRQERWGKDTTQPAVENQLAETPDPQVPSNTSESESQEKSDDAPTATMRVELVNELQTIEQQQSRIQNRLSELENRERTLRDRKTVLQSKP